MASKSSPGKSTLTSTSCILPVHKPSGPTSRRVVDEVEEASGGPKIGHGGTLDSRAEGVLPMHLNEATKVVSCLHKQPKTYRVRCRFDLRSETLDSEAPVEHCPPGDPPAPNELLKVIGSFEGRLNQVPPDYSAVQIKGRALHDWARNPEVEVPEAEARAVECYSIELLDYTFPSLTLEVTSGKGFYIRSLIRDLSSELSLNGGMVTALVRTSYGPYTLDDCVLLYTDPDEWNTFAKPPKTALRNIISFRNCSAGEIERLTNGGRINRRTRETTLAGALDPDGRLRALLEPANSDNSDQWKPRRVLNL